MDLDELTPPRLDALLAFTRALTGDRGLAEDIVQEILLRLHTRAGPPIDNLDAYTRRMAVNEYISWRRKWQRITPVDTVRDVVEPDDTDRVVLRDALREEVSKLSRRHRAVLVLRYFADYTDAEIADALGCSQGTVRSYASRALAELRIEFAASATKESQL